MADREVLLEAIDRFGPVLQMIVAMEEMAELQKEISKAIRLKLNLRNLAEEIADVEIMLAQLKLIYSCEDKVDEWKRSKLDRLKKRLEVGDG